MRLEDLVSKDDIQKLQKIAYTPDYSQYVWIDKSNKSIKLIDMNCKELNDKYNHCYQMLYNQVCNKPGKLVLLDMISKTINKIKSIIYFYEQIDEGVKQYDIIKNVKSMNDDNIKSKYIIDFANGKSGFFNCQYINKSSLLRVKNKTDLSGNTLDYILSLKGKSYNSMSYKQLKDLLSVLELFIDTTKREIRTWSFLMDIIEDIAKFKGFTLIKWEK